jgi:hypothetical protein
MGTTQNLDRKAVVVDEIDPVVLPVDEEEVVERVAERINQPLTASEHQMTGMEIHTSMRIDSRQGVKRMLNMNLDKFLSWMRSSLPLCLRISEMKWRRLIVWRS